MTLRNCSREKERRNRSDVESREAGSLHKSEKGNEKGKKGRKVRERKEDRERLEKPLIDTHRKKATVSEKRETIKIENGKVKE